jgi:hypothetical protein
MKFSAKAIPPLGQAPLCPVVCMVVYFDRKIAPTFMIPPHIYLKIPAAIWNNVQNFTCVHSFYFILFSSLI